MNQQERSQKIAFLLTQVHANLERKNQDYSEQESANSNFHENAKKFGLTPYQVWGIYAYKHLDVFRDAIKKCPENPVQALKSDTMLDRIIDSIGYLAILYSMLVEDEKLEPIGVIQKIEEVIKSLAEEKP